MWIQNGAEGSGVADGGHTPDGVAGGCADGINIGPTALFNTESECQPGTVHAMGAACESEN